jgi:hypothetical protein
MRGFGSFVLGLILGGFLVALYFENGGLRLMKGLENRKNNNSVGEHKNFNLDSEKIRDELSRSGQVIREKSKEVGAKVEDATITAIVEGKFAVDRNLSGSKINVTTHDGTVTLSGNTDSADIISEAVQLAMDTPGVEKVIWNTAIEPTGSTTNSPERSLYSP